MLYHFVLSLIISGAVTQVAIFSTTIYLHRTATHRALTLHPAVEWVFKFVLWLTTGQETKEWVAVHRKHHAFTDVEGDPHSPVLAGFWSVQLGNVFHYVHEVKELRRTGELERYSQGIENGWWDRTLFNHGLLGLGIGTTVLCLVLGLWWGLLAAGLHAVIYVFGLTSSINGLCHMVGYRNFENPATNIRSLAVITGGEGLHNNHHGFPRSPKFSWQGHKGEVDPAWPIVQTLVTLHLATRFKTIEETVA